MNSHLMREFSPRSHDTTFGSDRISSLHVMRPPVTPNPKADPTRAWKPRLGESITSGLPIGSQWNRWSLALRGDRRQGCGWDERSHQVASPFPPPFRPGAAEPR